jgi:hypothetical protein
MFSGSSLVDSSYAARWELRGCRWVTADICSFMTRRACIWRFSSWCVYLVYTYLSSTIQDSALTISLSISLHFKIQVPL